MESLIDALVLYALENRVSRFHQETAMQTRAAWRKMDQLTERLNALSPEAAQYTEQLHREFLTINSNYERASLLAGLSIGLELGRL